MSIYQESSSHLGLSSKLAMYVDQKTESCALFSVYGRSTFDEIIKLSGISDKASIYTFNHNEQDNSKGITYDLTQHDSAGLQKAELSILCDCLEFVEDPAALIAGLAKKTDKALVVSYPGKEFYPNEKERVELGWKNHFIKDDIISLFTYRDFMVSHFEINHRLKRLIFQFKTGRQNTVQDNFLCCGCSACVYRCPTGAIYEKQDEYGIYRAYVNYDKCTTCGKCSRACPVITYRPPKKNTNTPKCFVFENDESIRMQSAATGGFQVMAKHFINHGGKVAGAAWIKDERGNYTKVRHVLASSEDELEKIYKSKYLQSDIGDIFAKIKEELGKGTKILFSGLPCQVAGLYNAIGRGHDNLFTVDLLCHSVSSQKYFRQYLDEQYGPGNVKEYDFRAKRKDLKPGLYATVKLTSGEELLFSPARKETYFNLYLSFLIMPEFCENCRFTGFPKQADLTLADTHGIEKYYPEFLLRRAELALLNNSKGEELFSIIRSVAIKTKEVDFEIATKNNRTNKGNKAHQMRDVFKATMLMSGGTETAEIIFRQNSEISRLRREHSIQKIEIDRHEVEISTIRLYYRHTFLNMIIKTLVSRKMIKKLKHNPRQFFSDSKSRFIKLLGRYYN